MRHGNWQAFDPRLCFSPSFLDNSRTRVNFVDTNVKVKLPGTLLWFDSRISLLQEKLQACRWFWNVRNCMNASLNPACKSLLKTLWKNNGNIVGNIGNYYIINFVLELTVIGILAEKVIYFLREAHFDVVIIMVNQKCNIPSTVKLKHVVRNLNVRPDSSVWHNRYNSVLLGSCESKQGQGGKLGHGGMWKIPWTQLSSWFIRKQYHLIIMRDQNPPPPMTNMLNGLTTRHPLWPICWIG